MAGVVVGAVNSDLKWLGMLAATGIAGMMVPVLASRVRLLGSGKSQKNDPNDARAIAIAAFAFRPAPCRGTG